MNMTEKLLNILLREMIEEEKMNLRENLTVCLCAYTKELNPNELDMSKTFISNVDDNRYYVSVTTKKGIRMTIPLNKRFFKDDRVRSLIVGFHNF